jgi:hypothetical protein|tara:strand:+ start:63 stop:434 length:372 start_codon:yes stop_codon:yes gene_type:complete
MIDIKESLDIATKEQTLAYVNAPLDMDWNEFQKYMKPYNDKVSKYSLAYRSVMLPTYRECPTYGRKMSLESFIENCEGGGFIDYDGSGNYMKDGLMSDISIYPSDIRVGSIRKDFDSIIWFNR